MKTPEFSNITNVYIYRIYFICLIHFFLRVLMLFSIPVVLSIQISYNTFQLLSAANVVLGPVALLSPQRFWTMQHFVLGPVSESEFSTRPSGSSDVCKNVKMISDKELSLGALTKFSDSSRMTFEFRQVFKFL